MNKKKINVGIIGLGQIGSRLYKEIISKKNDIELKTGSRVNIAAISAKNYKKKRNFKFKKNIFYKNPLLITQNPKIDIVFELIGFSDGISKKIIDITNNCTLVAHNADFDYRVLRNEFTNIGVSFNRKTLCKL